ncbi:MAG: histidine kinase [Myxococcaceae bacterium]|nr:histidine kinase [Myxococcaceae bacterium]
MDLERLTREELLELLQGLLARQERALVEQQGYDEQQSQVVHELQVYQVELEMQNRELRETQGALERSRKRFQQLFDSAPLAYITFDATGAVESLNEAALALLRTTRGAAHRAPFVTLTGLTDHASFAALLRRTRESGKQTAELALRVAGVELFVEAVITVCAEPEASLDEYRCALVDVTERRRVERERTRLHEVERTLHHRFELLDRISLVISTALTQAEHNPLEALPTLIVEQALELLQPLRATLSIDPGFTGGRAIELSRSQASAQDAAPGDGYEGASTIEVCVPLRVALRHIGELRVAFGGDYLPTHEQPARTLELLADRLALALEIARLHALEARERARLALLHRVSRELSECSDAESSLQALRHASQAPVPDFAQASLVFTCDHQGACKLLGVAHPERRSQRLLERLAPRFERALHEWLTREVLHGPRAAELSLDLHEVPELRRLAQRVQLGSLYVVPLLAGERVLGAMCFAHREHLAELDTHVLRPLRELASLCAAALEHVRLLEELRTAVDSRDTLLAIVSHDLRSPLSAISMTARILGRSDAEPERRRSGQHVDLIQRSVARMSHLVEDLLHASQIDAGQLEMNVGALDPCVPMEEARKLNLPLIEGSSLHCEVDCPRGLPPVAADRQRLLQVFGNLIGNATKFTPREGQLRLSAEVVDGYCKFGVSDTGPGIPSHMLSKVFVRYWTGRARRSGLGLGLYIAERIVAAHGGRIWAESPPGKGTSFYFTIPLAQAAVSHERRPAAADATSVDASSHPTEPARPMHRAPGPPGPSAPGLTERRT